MEMPGFFVQNDENEIALDSPEMSKMLSRFRRMTEDSIEEILEMTATRISRWGTILRVIYYGSVDGEKLEDKQIFLSWKPQGGIEGVCFSSLEEDGFWNK